MRFNNQMKHEVDEQIPFFFAKLAELIL